MTTDPTADRPMDADRARQDLVFMNDVMRRSQARVDPHLFHFVHWGLIVLVWYPLANWFQNHDLVWWQLPLGGTAIVLGVSLSCGREILLARRPRLKGFDTFVTRQMSLITTGCIGAGLILSGLAPAFDLVQGENVPILWGLVYANLAFVTGVVLDRKLLLAAAAIFVGVILAIVFQQYNGYILGPFMGLGMIIPGLSGEARVRRLVQEGELEAGRV